MERAHNRGHLPSRYRASGNPYDGAASFRKGASEAPKRVRSLTPHVAPSTENGVALAGLGVFDAGDTADFSDWNSLSRQVTKKLHEIVSFRS
ncbi:arginase family protein [Candidatus Bipolaricaulota bacterium]